MILSGLAGFALGLVLLVSIALGQAGAIPFAALVQAHGQVQALGFVGLFVLGTAAQLLPGFLATPLQRRRELVIGGYLAAAGLAARVIGQPLPFGVGRDVLLALSAIGELGGFGLALVALAELPRRSIQPPDPWQTFARIGFGFLGLSLVVNAVAVGTLIAGTAVVPAPLDAALVDLELWGFGGFVAFAVAWKVLPRFLILPAPGSALARAGATTYLVGVALEAGAQLALTARSIASVGPALLLAEWLRAIGVLIFLLGLRLYLAPTRASGAPAVTEPARRWVRIAFAWLLVAALLAALWTTRSMLLGAAASYFDLGASRHALGQGFFLTLIVALGARILPGFSGWAIAHPRYLDGVIAAVTVGAVLRVLGEIGLALALNGSAPLASLGGALGVLGFLAFGLALIREVGKRAVH